MHTGKQEDSIFLSQTDNGKVDLVQLGNHSWRLYIAIKIKARLVIV